MSDHQQRNESSGEASMQSNSMSSALNKPFFYEGVLARQCDESRTGVCPKCKKPVKVLGWVTHSNKTRHIVARCRICGRVFLAQTKGNRRAADTAGSAKTAKYGKQTSLV